MRAEGPTASASLIAKNLRDQRFVARLAPVSSRPGRSARFVPEPIFARDLSGPNTEQPPKPHQR